MSNRARRGSQDGVTLIEVLVGIVIGMIAMIAIFQVVSVWEARTRVNNSTGDAQVAGSLAMFNLERDLRLAGMGFGTAGRPELDCNVVAFDNVASGAANFNLRPISITDNDATGQPDVIEVLYGNSAYYSKNEEFGNASATTLEATLKYGFKRGDIAVMTDKASTCRLLQITDDTSPDDHILTFAPGSFTSFYTNTTLPVRYNSGSASMPTISAGYLYNLGPIPRRNEWTVDTATSTLGYINRMAVVDVNLWSGVAEGVVNLKAQYGYDANSDNRIDDTEWRKALPATPDWTRVRAIRVAMLVRGREFQAPPSDPTAPTYRLTVAPSWVGGAFAMKNLDGTADSDVLGSPNNWRYYRYRVYERVVPLRNMFWGQP